MKITKNIGEIDRLIRFFLAGIFFLIALFWTYGVLQIIAYIFGIIMLITSLVKYCILYNLFKINTFSKDGKKLSKTSYLSFVLLYIFIITAGIYTSIFFTKKIFLEDFNKMNQFYKQTLFFTGQNNRTESLNNYDNLTKGYDVFYQKYSKYHPYVISSDEIFDMDILEVKNIISSMKEKVATGDLQEAHKDFEAIRPVFQEILKRNGFSILAVYLVDFHDAMEKVIAAADAKDVTLVIEVYPEVSDKLKSVEEVTNDEEIQNIRQKLERVVSSARNGDVNVLSAQAAELKSSFVKVYLKRG
ncbi:MAG: DUF2892 domain-containing protein [Candidatus Paceibacterota bacterium]|jgi:hypothetical protein